MVSKTTQCKPAIAAPSSLWVIQDESGRVMISESKPDPKMYPPEEYKITAYSKKSPPKKGGKKKDATKDVATSSWKF